MDSLSIHSTFCFTMQDESPIRRHQYHRCQLVTFVDDPGFFSLKAAVEVVRCRC